MNTVTYSLRRDRGHNWSMTVYVNGRDVTSVGFAWERPTPQRAQQVAEAVAARLAKVQPDPRFS